MHEEHLTEQQINTFHVGDEDALRIADAHLAACEVCRQRVCATMDAHANAHELFVDLQATIPDLHLTYAEATDFVQFRMDAVEQHHTALHIEDCARCHSVVEGLREIAAAVVQSVAKAPEAAAALSPAAGREPDSVEAKGGIWSRLLGFVSRPPGTVEGNRTLASGWQYNSRLVPALAMGGVFALAVVAVMLNSLLSMQSRISTLETQLARSGTTVPKVPPHIDDSQLKEIARLESENRKLAESNGKLAVQMRALRAAKPRVGPGPSVPQPSKLLAGGPADGRDYLQRGHVTMGGGTDETTFQLQEPVGTKVGETSPNFRWTAFKDAVSYTVSVIDWKTQQVVAEKQATTAEARLNKPLVRGRVYGWQVSAKLAPDASGESRSVNGVPAPARFKIASDQDLAALAALAKARQSTAISLMNLGMLDEAERDLQAILAANPKDTGAMALLKRLHAMRESR